MITDDDMNLIIRDWTEQPTTLRRGGLTGPWHRSRSPRSRRPPQHGGFRPCSLPPSS